MNRNFGLILVISVFFLISIVHICGMLHSSPNKDLKYELVQSIDSLRIKIDSLSNYRSSLKTIVDTNKVRIIEVEKRYETIRNHIITQSVDSDCITFSNYLSNYQRFSSVDNSSTIEGN